MDEEQFTNVGDTLSSMAAQCACLNMRKVSRAVTQFFDDALDSTGLRSTQLALLVAVATHDRPSLTDLGDILVMDPSTVSRVVKPLHARGLLTTAPGADRRRRTVALTEAGRTLVAEAVPLWRGAQERLLAGLGPDVWAGMRTDLMRTLDVVQHMNASA